MTRTPSSPRYLELSSSVTFIWLFIVGEARACVAAEAASEAGYRRYASLPRNGGLAPQFLFVRSNFPVFDYASPTMTFRYCCYCCYCRPIIRRSLFFFFSWKGKRAVIKCNAFQMITRDSFISVMHGIVGSDWGINLSNGQNYSPWRKWNWLKRINNAGVLVLNWIILDWLSFTSPTPILHPLCCFLFFFKP